jgi:cation:H+ antiporter
VVDGHGTEADHPLYLSRVGLPENLGTIIVQLALGLALIVVGAKGFVVGVEHLSAWLGVSVLVLSLLIVPVATELPEKINSILWIRRHRDTLAFGNVTGAMVFQGSLLPALGILLTPWEPRPEVLVGMGLTLAASIYLFLMLRRGALRPIHLVLNGICYATYFVMLLRHPA